MLSHRAARFRRMLLVVHISLCISACDWRKAPEFAEKARYLTVGMPRHEVVALFGCEAGNYATKAVYYELTGRDLRLAELNSGGIENWRANDCNIYIMFGTYAGSAEVRVLQYWIYKRI